MGRPLYLSAQLFMRADTPPLASLGRNRSAGHDTHSAHLVGTANRIDRRDRTVDHGHFGKCLCDLAKSLSSCREFCRCTRALRAGRLGESRGGVGLSIAPGPDGHVAILHAVDGCLEGYHQQMSARRELPERPLADSWIVSKSFSSFFPPSSDLVPCSLLFASTIPGVTTCKLGAFGPA